MTVFPNPHHYKLLKLIEANPAIQQREMAKVMGISLGKANYCLQALVQKGLVKMDNFRRADNKLAYSYLLTPSGIEAKARLTVSFLKHKVAEYEAIRNEIEELQRDAAKDASV
jgi:EPS-associated MarR family transcriptional regulator